MKGQEHQDPRHPDPKAVTTLEDLFMQLDLDWNSVASGPGRLDLAELGRTGLWKAGSDVWVKALIELGMALHDNANGTLEITCPWVGQHSDAQREGTAYLGGGNFKCQHDHCKETRKTPEFKAEVEERLALEGKSLGGLLVGMRRPEEAALEDAYLAKLKEEDELFGPPPPRPPGARAPMPMEGLSFEDEAEAVARLIYVQAEQVFLDELTGAVLAPKQVDEALWKVPSMVTTTTGSTMIRRGQKAVSNELLTRGGLRRVHHRVYRPGLARFIDDEFLNGLPAVNVWRAPSLVAEPPGQWLQAILDHIKGRLFVGDPVEAEIWLDWSAALVQRPAEKCNWMPLVVGGGGTGKDLLFKLYGALVGGSNLYITGSDLMIDRASRAEAPKHKLIMIEELFGSGRRDMDNTLKSWIAAPPATIAVRGFRKGPEVMAKVANLAAFSNNIDALTVGTEAERRRYFIYESKAVALTKAEGVALAEAVEKGAGEFLGYLLRRDLSNWNPFFKPVTAATVRSGDRMMVAGMSGSAQKVLVLVEEGELAGRDLILSSELGGAMDNARIPAREQQHVLPEAMKAGGFVVWADRKQLRMPGGMKPRVWVREGSVPKDVHDWDATKMRTAVEAEQQARASSGPFGADNGKVVPIKKG